MEEALADSKWAQAIQEEMEVLPKEILRLVGRLILFVPDITYYLCDQCILPMWSVYITYVVVSQFMYNPSDQTYGCSEPNTWLFKILTKKGVDVL